MKTELIEAPAASGADAIWAELLVESERTRPPIQAPVLPRGRARQKLAVGEPLLHGEPFRLDEAFGRELFGRLLDALGRQTDGTEAAAIAGALDSGRLDLGRALEEALPAHADHLAALADWSGLPLHPLADLLEVAVRPSLRALAAAYRPLLETATPWRRAYCPLCGAAGLPEAAGRRCPRCAASWTAPGRLPPDSPCAFRLELGEPEPDEALEDLLELD